MAVFYTLNLIKTKPPTGWLYCGRIYYFGQFNPKNTGKGGSVRKKLIRSIAFVQDHCPWTFPIFKSRDFWTC